jgi:hypothetical protein
VSFGGRKNEAQQRAAERRRRENEAPRLQGTVPRLATLRLEIEERRGTEAVSHVKRVVVENAPALFVLSCLQKGCHDGGHDVTREVLSALARGEDRFGGRSTCQGQIGPTGCGSQLAYVGVATYRP